jgi:chromosome segregation ATPase
VSKNTDQHKQNAERLTLENADLQTKLDTQAAEFKKEKLARKSIESKLQLSEDELGEARSNLTSMQKLMDERKRKHESDRAQFELEIDELKKAHHTEQLVLKDKLARLKADTSEAQAERVKQIEEELVAEWRAKLEQALEQAEQKYERKVGALEAELVGLRQQADEAQTLVKTLRLEVGAEKVDNEKLRQRVEDLQVVREKYERLQAQALVMKERYETRIKELLDAEPDAEVIGEEIKKLMNLMYRRLKVEKGYF